MGLFASSSSDRTVTLWDLSKSGSEIKNEDQQDGPAEVLFVHSGHTAKVNDMSWNQNEEFMMSSVDENNII
jgi:histone-binding protein RBBP4